MTKVPRADNHVSLSINGPAGIVATDNDAPADLTAFPSLERQVYSGLDLAIVGVKTGAQGSVTATAKATDIRAARTTPEQ